MAHANVIGNHLITDSESGDYRRFGSQVQSRFNFQIDKLAGRISEVPLGWHHLFRDAVRMLRAVDCPKRNGIEFSEPEIQFGEFRLRVYFGPTDKAVRAIVRKLITKTTCTCCVCGRGIGAVLRKESDRVLCAGCYVRTDLQSELEQWLEIRANRNIYKSRLLMEFKELPLNIQFVIPKQKIKTLHLSDVKPIQYVTPGDVQDQVGKLGLMMRYLNKQKMPG